LRLLRFANLSSSANLAASANLASSAWRASSAICAGEKFPDIFADAETGNGAVGVTNGTAEETNGTAGFFFCRLRKELKLLVFQVSPLGSVGFVCSLSCSLLQEETLPV
jgi:hypothetical protein